MPYQSQSAGLVAYKVQSALGTQATAPSGNLLRIAGGNGAQVSKASVESVEVRNDGLSTRGRHGSQKASSGYNGELSLGSHDPIVEAIMRSTWDSTALTKTQADFTSLTTGANTIVMASGNPITMGFRVGDIIRPTGLPDVANNAKNLRITALSATTITVAETLVVNAAADTTCSITRPGKRLINTASLVKRYFTIEEYESDIDQSTLLTDFVWGTGKFSMSPDGLIRFDPGGVGTGNAQALTSGASPYFTAPTAPVDVPFSVVDATIRFGGVDLVELTSFDISLDIQPNAPVTFGTPAQKYSPDVFTGPLKIGMNLTLLRKSLAIFSDFLAETPYSLNILAVDNMSKPKDFLSITVPNFTLGGVNPSALSKQGGPRTQTIAIPPALVGVDTSTTGNGSMISFQTTAP
ncbi:phage tail tube protein [Bradyrhizobium sp. WSM4349]|uniref:phage tail tube protein n=1 Tax=Bradyrhizobium sp. WSM4349 TaxID=1040988 RepID=UPI00035F1F1B|nr:phage tail tube protein [Bradyrhizobium sp. WSM4349]